MKHFHIYQITGHKKLENVAVVKLCASEMYSLYLADHIVSENEMDKYIPVIGQHEVDNQNFANRMMAYLTRITTASKLAEKKLEMKSDRGRLIYPKQIKRELGAKIIYDAIALVIIGVTIQVDYYSSMIFAMGFALIFSSILQFLRYYHNTRPENVEAYRKKVRQQEINLKDERKIQLRNRAGYISWAVTMVACFIASFIAALFRAGTLIVCILAGVAVAEYILATIIYRYLCKKM